MDIVDDLRDLNSMHTPKEASDIGEKAATEIERLRKTRQIWWKSYGVLHFTLEAGRQVKWPVPPSPKQQEESDARRYY